MKNFKFIYNDGTTKNYENVSGFSIGSDHIDMSFDEQTVWLDNVSHIDIADPDGKNHNIMVCSGKQYMIKWEDLHFEDNKIKCMLVKYMDREYILKYCQYQCIGDTVERARLYDLNFPCQGYISQWLKYGFHHQLCKDALDFNKMGFKFVKTLKDEDDNEYEE